MLRATISRLTEALERIRAVGKATVYGGAYNAGHNDAMAWAAYIAATALEKK